MRVFLPRLPADALVVVASRQLPDPGWRADLGGTDFLRVLALRNLAPDEAITLLDRRGVPGTLQEAVLAFASGHPHYVTWQGAGEIEETPLSPEDRNAVGALAAEAEGEESAAIADFWLSRQPGAFVIYRRVPAPVSGQRSDRHADTVAVAACRAARLVLHGHRGPQVLETADGLPRPRSRRTHSRRQRQVLHPVRS
jgi:hypothetical protein